MDGRYPAQRKRNWLRAQGPCALAVKLVDSKLVDSKLVFGFYLLLTYLFFFFNDTWTDGRMVLHGKKRHCKQDRF